MINILLAIAALCNSPSSLQTTKECQKAYIGCVRDAMSQSPVGTKEDFLWECAIKINGLR